MRPTSARKEDRLILINKQKYSGHKGEKTCPLFAVLFYKTGSVKNTKLTYFLLPKERELSETGFKTYFETAPFLL